MEFISTLSVSVDFEHVFLNEIDVLYKPYYANLLEQIDKNKLENLCRFAEMLHKNGFEDLAKFDLDGNGWIDEDDSAFSKLKVWTKSENGNNILMSIKDAGVGAIYLGTANTRFALNNLVDNSTNGVIQKSGIYLMENGEANTIMHVDFAV